MMLPKRETGDDIGTMRVVERNDESAASGCRLQECGVLTALNRIVRAVKSEPSVETACRKAVAGVVRALRPDAVGLFLREGDAFRPTSVAQLLDDSGGAPVQVLSACPCGRALCSERSVCCDDIHDRESCRADNPCARSGFRSVASVAIRFGEEFAGKLCLASKCRGAFEPYEMFLETVADVLAIRVHNARLLDKTLADKRRLKEQMAKRKQAEAALQESEEKFRTIFELAPYAISLNDLEGRYVDLNQAGCKSLDMAREDILGRRVTELYAPPFPDHAAEATRRFAETGALDNEEVSLVHGPTGVRRDILYSSRRVTIAGTPLVLSVTVDVTEHKRALSDLEASEKRYRSVFENTGTGMALIENDMTVSMVNAGFEKLTGYSRSEIEGNMKWSAFIAEKDLPRMKGYHQARRENPDAAPTEYQAVLVDREGIEKTVLVKVGLVPGTRTSVSSFIDISDRKKMEKAIRNREYQFRTLVNSTPEGIALCDLDGYFVTTNKSFAKITGYGDQELAGRHYGEIVSDDARLSISRNLAVMRAGIRQEDPLEIQFTRKDGAAVFLNIRGWLVNDENSLPVALGAFVRDVTGQKRLVAEKKALERQLLQHQKMEALGTLAGGIAHDFNNILWGILGFSELALLNLENDPEKARHGLKRVLEACERAKDMVRQILQFSRQSESAVHSLDIAGILKEAVKLLRVSIPSNIEVRLEIAPGVGNVRADATRIHQVIMNLCTNAYQSMRDMEQGLLSVSLDMTTTERETIGPFGNMPPGRYVRLAVSDTGCGIAAEHMDRVFDPYFTTRAQDRGTGLGLSVSLGIVRNHGGYLTMTSQPGEGAVFTVYLPATHEGVDVSSGEAAEVPTGSERILFVDDEKIFIEMAAELLSGLGYAMTCVHGGVEGFEAFMAGPGSFDLVITDLSMPKMTGLEMVRRIRCVRPDVPVILCTGFSEHVPRESLVKKKIAKVLHKPVGRRELARAIREVLDADR